VVWRDDERADHMNNDAIAPALRQHRRTSPPRRLGFVLLAASLHGPSGLSAPRRASCRLLWAPTQILQQPTHVVDVALHPEASLDQFDHGGAGPQIGAKSGRQRALQQ